jgi:diaminohydroxyphosphoribosylaminopyrimidine deaminase / 5-amino-6-(5-phosphoribosylamino)uracil reductase
LSQITDTTFSEEDRSFMKRALELARNGRFTTSPNPRVGCVIARPSSNEKFKSQIIGEGYHLRKGEPHAERVALANCTEAPIGATMYVTLEPCCHHGATPPCTDAIIDADVDRVVVAIRDPFHEVKGKGIETLRENDIQVDVGLLEDECWFENRFFFHYHTNKKPWVILKAAISLDGKMASKTGHSKWITGDTARAHAHEIRAETDAILTGVGTIIADDPLLTSRMPGIEELKIKQSTRIVLDPQLEIKRDAQVIRTYNQAPIWIFCHDSAPDYAIQELTFFNASVTSVGGERQALDLHSVLESLAASGIQSILVEGGPKIHTAFLESGLANELLLYIAPKIVGGSEAPSFFLGEGVELIDQAMQLDRVERTLLDQDTLIRGILRR